MKSPYYSVSSWNILCKKNPSNQMKCKVLCNLVITLISRNFWSHSNNAQCGKMKNLLSPIKKFRQINCLVSSVVKTLFSRNFCQRSVVTLISRNFWSQKQQILLFAHFSVKLISPMKRSVSNFFVKSTSQNLIFWPHFGPKTAKIWYFNQILVHK